MYAASKRSNELIAHAYSALYRLPTVGMRFFTAYGPWGRPDQALFIFTKNIIENKKIDLFNYGNHSRDFTYVEDIADAIFKATIRISKRILNGMLKNLEPSSSIFPFNIYNIGANKRVNLKYYVKILEKYLKKKLK